MTPSSKGISSIAATPSNIIMHRIFAHKPSMVRKFDGFRLRLPLFHFEQRGGEFLGIIGWHHRNDRGENLVPPPIMVRTMDQSYFREQAERCRRLARDSSDFALQVRLRRLADDYQMYADEIEHDEIFSALGADRSTY
jgi:hypothetical protein